MENLGTPIDASLFIAPLVSSLCHINHTTVHVYTHLNHASTDISLHAMLES